MSIAPFLFIAFAIYIIPAAIGSLLIARVAGKGFSSPVLLYLTMPIFSWLIFVFLRDKGKSLSNLVVEPLVLAVAVCIMIAGYLIIEHRGVLLGKSLEVLIGAFLFIITVGVYLWMPTLPE